MGRRKKRKQPQAAAHVATPAPDPPSRWQRLLSRIPFLGRGREPQFTRQEVLSACPFRNDLIEWELREEGADAVEVVVLKVPRRQDRWGRVLNRFFEGPGYRQVVLDELGTDVWQLCDGRTSIEELIRALARKHRLERREVEVSLTTYLKTLAKRGFIGLHMDRPPGTE